MYFPKKKTKKKGFTLIELLVVIAIIGILATIVVVNVNSARQKAQDVAVKGSLDALRAGLELFYDSQAVSTYVGFNASADYLRASTTIGAISSAPVFYGNATSAAISAALKSSGFWCIDSSGNSMSAPSNLTSNDTVCP